MPWPCGSCSANRRSPTWPTRASTCRRPKARSQRHARDTQGTPMADLYRPRDTLHLWWLGEPRPRLVGDLVLVLGGRGVGLRYAPAWLRDGFALSEDLPLRQHLFIPRVKDRAA